MDDRIRRVLIWSLIIFLFFFGCIFSLLISPVMLILPVLITGIILLLIKLVAPDLWRVMVPHKPRKAPQTDDKKEPFKADMILEKADGTGAPVRISKPVFCIGRSDDNDYRLSEDGTVTRHHCKIEWDRESHLYYIVYLDSTHGTFVNQERLTPNEPKMLSDGCVIRISDQSFFFRKAKN